jgi:hypothetical protein
MSELKVNKISPRSGTDVTLGDSYFRYQVVIASSATTLPDSSVSLAKLTATGTKDATTFLRGDNTFATPTDSISKLDSPNTTSAITYKMQGNAGDGTVCVFNVAGYLGTLTAFEIAG